MVQLSTKEKADREMLEQTHGDIVFKSPSSWDTRPRFESRLWAVRDLGEVSDVLAIKYEFLNNV